jgi:hypothetical protein
LAQGDFHPALRGPPGTGTPLSAAAIARLKAGWQVEHDTWKRRRVDEFEPVYIWADGIYVQDPRLGNQEEKDEARNDDAERVRSSLGSCATQLGAGQTATQAITVAGTIETIDQSKRAMNIKTADGKFAGVNVPESTPILRLTRDQEGNVNEEQDAHFDGLFRCCVRRPRGRCGQRSSC